MYLLSNLNKVVNLFYLLHKRVKSAIKTLYVVVY